MPDHLTKKQRSDLMRRIKGKDTLPERLLSDALASIGCEHERNDNRIPGTPDISILNKRVAVFVHGCFWHGCPLHYREPKTRQQFWRHKLQRTKARDRMVRNRLLSMGWKVITVWEHEARRRPLAVAWSIAESEGTRYRGSVRFANHSHPLRRL